VSSIPFTLACGEHGEMGREPRAYGWVCAHRACRTYVPDEDIFYLVTSAARESPEVRGPVPVVVTALEQLAGRDPRSAAEMFKTLTEAAR